MASIARLDVLTWPTFGSTFGSLVLSMVFGSLVSWMGLARAHSFIGGSLLTLPAGWQITDMAWIWPAVSAINIGWQITDMAWIWPGYGLDMACCVSNQYIPPWLR